MTTTCTATILVIDADPDRRAISDILLPQLGPRVARVRPQDPGFEAWLRQPLVALVLDVPGSQALTLAGQLRGRSQLSHTPLIFLTDPEPAWPLEEAYGLGWVDCLNKPVSPLILKAKLDVFVELQRVKQERFHSVINQTTVGFLQTDAEGRMTTVNPTWCKMLGYPAEALLGRKIADVTHPDDLARSREAVAALASGGPNFAIDKRYVRRDGSTLWTVSSVSALRGPMSEFQGLGAIVLDVSEHKRAEDELRRQASDLSTADRHKSEFLATLAHELRNPLAPLSNSLQLMRIAGINDQMKAEACVVMQRQLTNMVHLVDELLDIARISSGKIVLNKEELDIGVVVMAAVESSAALIQAGHHRLTLDVPASLPRLRADRSRLTQVLSNLLNNAAKYTPDGGHIRLSVHVDASALCVSVADNGVGLTVEAQQQVFDMFTQVGGHLDRSQGGLGIGLSLARRLAHLHGGTLTAGSPGPGQGSTFTLCLPLQQETLHALPVPSHQPVAAQAAQAAPVASRSFRILAVDDNLDGVSTLASLLQLSGHQTALAMDGQQALQVARDFRPDVVFLDISMPGMNGYEAAHALRHLDGLENCLLVALTGWGTEEDQARARLAGFDRHLTKPTDMAAIDDLLAQWSQRLGPHQSDKKSGGPAADPEENARQAEPASAPEHAPGSPPPGLSPPSSDQESETSTADT